MMTMFLQVVETARQRVEEYKRRTKERISGVTKPNTYSTDKTTNKEKENRHKKENKKYYNEDENKTEVKDKKSIDKRFASMQEALTTGSAKN
jgi:hypothetical protein